MLLGHQWNLRRRTNLTMETEAIAHLELALRLLFTITQVAVAVRNQHQTQFHRTPHRHPHQIRKVNDGGVRSTEMPLYLQHTALEVGELIEAHPCRLEALSFRLNLSKQGRRTRVDAPGQGMQAKQLQKHLQHMGHLGMGNRKYQLEEALVMPDNILLVAIVAVAHRVVVVETVIVRQAYQGGGTLGQQRAGAELAVDLHQRRVIIVGDHVLQVEQL